MAKKKKSSNESGIRELVWVDPKTIDDNPLNWRKHPARQKQAISASIKANGWAGTLIFNETTGRLVDGHARKDVAIRDGTDAVPVLLGNWTEEQEKHLLATLDPLGAMAETDAAALQSLTDSLKEDEEHLKDVEKEEKEILTDLTKQLEGYAHDVSTGAQKKTFLPKQRVVPDVDDYESIEEWELMRDDDALEVVINEDSIFFSTNDWGIPDLIPELLYDGCPDAIWGREPDFDVSNPHAWYCQSARPFPAEREGGILGFYTDDRRFEVTWNRKSGYTDRLLEEKWAAVCAPDFSILWEWPRAVKIYNIYRSRWLQRLWQEAGIPVLPALRWDHTDESFDYALSTLPEGMAVATVQCRNYNKDKRTWKRFMEGLEESISRLGPETILIYGGGNEDNSRYLKKLPSGTNYVLLDSYVGTRRKKMRKTFT